MTLEEIEKKIEHTKNLAIDTFKERHPSEARMYVQELQRLDRLKHGYIDSILRR